MKKVFILDDDKDVIEVLKHILGRQYEVVCRTNADGLLSAITSFNPDLILMDNCIGEQNAADVVVHLRQSNPSFSVPIILFSAAHNINDIAAAIGTTAYLAKPASIQEIRDYVKRYTD